jgi:hypothetical protein
MRDPRPKEKTKKKKKKKEEEKEISFVERSSSKQWGREKMRVFA